MKYRCSGCGEVFEGELDTCPKCGKKMKYEAKSEVATLPKKEPENIAIPVEYRSEITLKEKYDFRILFYGILLVISSFLSLIVVMGMSFYITYLVQPVQSVVFIIKQIQFDGTFAFGALVPILISLPIMILNFGMLLASLRGIRKGTQTIGRNSLPRGSRHNSFEIREKTNFKEKFNFSSMLLFDTAVIVLFPIMIKDLQLYHFPQVYGIIYNFRLLILLLCIGLLFSISHFVLAYARKVIVTEIRL